MNVKKFCEFEKCNSLTDFLSASGKASCQSHISKLGGPISNSDLIYMEMQNLESIIRVNGLSEVDSFYDIIISTINILDWAMNPSWSKESPSDVIKHDIAAMVATHQERNNGDIIN